MSRFFSIFGCILAIVFAALALIPLAFAASSLRWSAGSALKSLGNFVAFSGPDSKYKTSRQVGGALRNNKDLLVINNQSGHQFLYSPASSTKITTSASTHILASQSTLHHLQQQQQQQHQQQQQQQMYSATNGTLSNLSAAGGQSNNYYYGLMPFVQQQQQQQQQSQVHHLSQLHLNQAQQSLGGVNGPKGSVTTTGAQATSIAPSSYHHQANKSTISNESANSTPSSSGVESGNSATILHQANGSSQQACLIPSSNNATSQADFNLMAGIYGGTHLHQHQPAVTVNTHYSSSLVPQIATRQEQQMREHIYECVEDEQNYSARLLMPTGTNINLLHHHQDQFSPSQRAMTFSSRMMQQQQQQQQSQNFPTLGKRMFGSSDARSMSSSSSSHHHTAIVRDQSPAKTNIICSKLAQVTPQRATELGRFQHDIMAIYNGDSSAITTATTATSATNPNSSFSGLNLASQSGKLSTDC